MYTKATNQVTDFWQSIPDDNLAGELGATKLTLQLWEWPLVDDVLSLEDYRALTFWERTTATTVIIRQTDTLNDFATSLLLSSKSLEKALRLAAILESTIKDAQTEMQSCELDYPLWLTSEMYSPVIRQAHAELNRMSNKEYLVMEAKNLQLVNLHLALQIITGTDSDLTMTDIILRGKSGLNPHKAVETNRKAAKVNSILQDAVMSWLTS